MSCVDNLFAFQESRAVVDVAFTDRHGGISGGPYSSLNLAQSGGDDRAAVAENIRLVTAAFAAAGGTTNGAGGDSDGAAGDSETSTAQPGNFDGSTMETRGPRLVRMHQVHGADVAVVDADTTHDPTADALVTATPGLVLMVRVADCVPVLLADVERRVVGAAHAGRPGMVAGVIAHTIAKMRDLGARDLTAWIGPHVCGSCYEVPDQMRAEVGAVVPEAFAETSWGTPSVDIGAGVLAQLAREGVTVVDASRCTIESEDLFSYRRQGAASGRLAGLVRVRP